jgi:hypothetical protein
VATLESVSISEAAGTAAHHQSLKDPAGQGAHQDDPHPLLLGKARFAPADDALRQSLGCWYIRL